MHLLMVAKVFAIELVDVGFYVRTALPSITYAYDPYLGIIWVFTEELSAFPDGFYGNLLYSKRLKLRDSETL